MNVLRVRGVLAEIRALSGLLVRRMGIPLAAALLSSALAPSRLAGKDARPWDPLPHPSAAHPSGQDPSARHPSAEEPERSSAAARPARSRAAAPPTAIVGGKVVTITRGVVEGGAVLLSGGRIEDVLPEAPGDLGARGYAVVDAAGLWVLPGFVEVHSHIGGSDINDMVYPINPGFRVVDNILPGNPLLERAQAGGVTTILFLPGSGTNLSGFGAILKTGGDTLDDVLVRSPGALKVSQGGNPERRGGDLGSSQMGMTTLLRSALLEGRRHAERVEAFESGRSAERPPFDPSLENFAGVFRGDLPVLVHTQGYLLVHQTMRLFHDELGLRVIIGHGTFEGSELSPEVARRGIRVANGPRQLRFDRERGSVVGLARRWADGGVEDLCVNTDAGVVPQEELFFQAAMAVRLGLDEETALRAITIHGARALGLGDRLGSIEEGKDADVVVWTGNPLDARHRVVLTLVDGRVVYDARTGPRRF